LPFFFFLRYSVIPKLSFPLSFINAFSLSLFTFVDLHTNCLSSFSPALSLRSLTTIPFLFLSYFLSITVLFSIISLHHSVPHSRFSPAPVCLHIRLEFTQENQPAHLYLCLV
jgi:hypothetical protein